MSSVDDGLSFLVFLSERSSFRKELGEEISVSGEGGESESFPGDSGGEGELRAGSSSFELRRGGERDDECFVSFFPTSRKDERFRLTCIQAPL